MMGLEGKLETVGGRLNLFTKETGLCLKLKQKTWSEWNQKGEAQTWALISSGLEHQVVLPLYTKCSEIYFFNFFFSIMELVLWLFPVRGNLEIYVILKREC